MEWGTRALTAFFVFAVLACASAITFGGVRLYAGAAQSPPVSRAFSWESGAYQVEGWIDRGTLKEIHILLNE